MISKFSDVAVGLSEDKLGFRDYADGVIATLESLSKEDTPFTIGIFGSWGSGKTSFMQIMQELLQSMGYETIFFKSWEYGNEEKPWIPFMIKVVDELFKDKIDKKELIRNIFLFSTDVVLQTYTQGKISTGDIINVYKGSRKTSRVKKWSDKDAKIVIERVTKIEEFKDKIKERAEESCLFSINIRVLDKLFHYCKLRKEALSCKFNLYLLNKYEKKMNNDTIPEKLKKKFETEEFPLSADATIRKERDDEWAITNGERIYIVKKEDGKIKIYENFENLQKISGYNPKVYRECNGKKGKSKHSYEQSSKGKIIIFIDDLDRIPEEKIVDFLDSLKIFLDISGCIFVLGCDYEILKNALKKKHGEEEIYKDYFDKIVQTEFYIPKISEQAIKNYLQFLTGWNAKEIEECTQLVIHSIGGNPRKIKRVVNATMLIKSVFEKKLATFLEEFERPKTRIKRGEEGEDEEEGEIEEPQNINIRIIFTPAEVFELLFNKVMLFKLMCMREQWPAYYEDILSEEKKQRDLISLEVGAIPIANMDYTELFSTAKGQKELEENVKKISDFLKAHPGFLGVDLLQKVTSLKTYLTLLEISSPDAGIVLKWGKPEKLPISLFNRYMLFEGINKGKVEVKDIENRINQRDWESDLKSYTFFIEVISLLKHDNLLRDLLFKDEEKRKQIAEKISDSEDPSTIGRLLGSVWRIDKGTARHLFNKESFMTQRDTHEHENVFSYQTKEKYAEKIKGTSTDPLGIGRLLYSVNLIDKNMAIALLEKTSETYAEKIKKNTIDPLGIGVLLYSVREINKDTAKDLLNKTWKTCAEKINAEKIKTGLDPLIACKVLLDVAREIDKKRAGELLDQTKDWYAEKIIASSDPGAIGELLNAVGVIDVKTAGELLNRTKDWYAEKIIARSDLVAIVKLLVGMRRINVAIARKLLDKTKDTVAEKIRDSTDPGAIGVLLGIVSLIEKETAKKLLNRTKKTYAKKIRDSIDPRAIGALLESVREINKKRARKLLNRTKKTCAKEIRDCTDPWAIGALLESVREINKKRARKLLNRAKKTYAKEIRDCTDPWAIGALLESVREIDKKTAGELLDETKKTYAEKIRVSTDPGAIGALLESVREIDKKTAGELLDETKKTYAKEIASPDPDVVGRLLDRMREIDKKMAGELLDETSDTYAKKIRDCTDPCAIGALLESVREIEEETARELLNKTSDTYAKEIIASPDPDVVGRLLDHMREIDKKTAGELLNETKKTYAEKIRDSRDLRAIGELLDSVREIDKERAKKLINKTKKTYAEKIKVSTDTGAIGALLESVREIDKETAEWLEKETKRKSEEK